MNLNEYMNTLMEQINNKRAKKLVEKEIRNHIEEQTETYEFQGMNYMDAEYEAVKQMGNPVETGINLNRIHRPQIPYSLLAIAFVLTIIGVLMQAVIFPQINVQYSSDIYSTYLSKTIIYNIIGFIVIIVILNLDYSFIAAHSMVLYVLYLIASIVISIFLRDYSQNYMTAYYTAILFPVVLAGLVYRFRNQKTIGLIKCILLSLVALGWLAFVFLPNMAGFMETIIVIACILTFAIIKNFFLGSKKLQLAILWSTITIPGIIMALSIFIPTLFNRTIHNYRLTRFLSSLSPEKYMNGMGYRIVKTRNSTKLFSVFGNSSLPDKANTDLYSTYLLNSIFSYFGIAVGITVIVAFVFFIYKAIAISAMQSNRIGFLIGITCSISVLLRVIVYIGINFGYSLWTTTSIPFLPFGFANTIINAVFIGLILSVYRNTNILGERNTIYKHSLKVVK